MHTPTTRRRRTLRRLLARFIATCATCGAPIPDDQVMCSICANK
ncbi:hypothetical protein FHU38_004650 [Saccharomonospora amisosensis]|uniref:Uncharacterized protein n=1 Tax=Saccharomonospora amisosensis TaxID=1128677 RepID=A0A7X5ZT67_9PSEU|nr:hypothetical protein [Saccharomonospora amisosensis]NIJ14306.1 hypothetical protein [Saccharomonospora amisosensis]